MKHVDEAKLEKDVNYRYQYVAEFTGFGDEDMSNLARFVRKGAGLPDGPMKA